MAQPQPPRARDEAALVEAALRRARRIQERAVALQTPQERRQQAELDRMIQHPEDKATLIQMTDQAFRSSAARRSADQLTHILDVQGVPRFFSPLDRTLLRGFQSFGGYLPGVAVPLVKEKMREETANVVLPAEPELLAEHLRARRAEGVRMNVNFLGEALLGEAEAERRLEGYLEALQNPDIEVVSVKISTIFSQISPLARDATVRRLADRFELLVRAASKEAFVRADGARAPKLVYLDMEEYRDLAITLETFVAALSRPGLEDGRAGIALQAYLPDSFAAQRRLTAWARERVASGGAPPTLRLVKGANMEMERVEASLRGWPAAPFQTKRETDANFKRMLRFALEPENARALRVGVASHNLFELAYALELAEARGVAGFVHLEMLEGMANHQRRALFEETRDLLLYAPACPREAFVHAIGYLVRRLDENTGRDNFLRHAFRLSVDSEAWQRLERDFVASFDAIDGLPDTPRRTQDRRRPPTAPSPGATADWPVFRNEPDTDFALPHHAAWAESIVDHWRDRHGPQALEVPLVVAGDERFEGRTLMHSWDPSRPGVAVARVAVGTREDVDEAVACAREDPDGWRARPARERGDVLRAAAQRLRERRAELLGVAMAEGGKIFPESDPEVSEAVDFCELYARSAQALAELPGVVASAPGVVAVIPPWNFPIAIPCGGVAAALAAGNTVILKPAPETVATAWLVARCFWDAGVGRALQLVYGHNDDAAPHLATHAGVDAVIFTGGTATARHLLKLDPGLRLLAETGGKNATIVTALSDRDLAVKHVVQSAFGHAGQKCSATSLLILEREVHEDPEFRRALCDAVESLPVGSAWELRTAVGPLIRPPRGPLERGLKELEAGESWAVRPRRPGDNPCLWTPGVKWGVRPGSPTHTTELFGPVLGVMRADGLDEAIDLVHRTGYGLTSGLQSLDDREQARWLERLRAGNLYVNRGTTGAVVMRQPFGGMARSAVGPGLKAGGPSYVAPLMRFREVANDAPGPGVVSDERVNDLLDALDAGETLPKTERDRLRRAAADYERAVADEFGREHDGFRLVGQDNLRRYLPIRALRIRVHPDDDGFELFARVLAARALGCGTTVSTPGHRHDVERLHELTEDWAAAVEFVEESDLELAEAIHAGQTGRVRYAAPDRVADVVRRSAAASGLYLATAPVLAVGRLELLHYLREQSVCIDYHRYGNLGARASEARAPVL
jgi:RHH-type proline utilization regulon transcriptional repressor/proline dehydrogenase/delta 1-pyrroline-5-carboxylate dehydrogenase